MTKNLKMAKTKKTAKATRVYVLHKELSKDIWEPVCSFNAANDADAKSKANGWALYQGMRISQVAVKPIEASLVGTSPEYPEMHNDWVR